MVKRGMVSETGFPRMTMGLCIEQPGSRVKIVSGGNPNGLKKMCRRSTQTRSAEFSAQEGECWEGVVPGSVWNMTAYLLDRS